MNKMVYLCLGFRLFGLQELLFFVHTCCEQQVKPFYMDIKYLLNILSKYYNLRGRQDQKANKEQK